VCLSLTEKLRVVNYGAGGRGWFLLQKQIDCMNLWGAKKAKPEKKGGFYETPTKNLRLQSVNKELLEVLENATAWNCAALSQKNESDG